MSGRRIWVFLVVAVLAALLVPTGSGATTDGAERAIPPKPFGKVFFGIDADDPDRPEHVVTVSQRVDRFGRRNIVRVLLVDYAVWGCGDSRHPAVVKWWARPVRGPGDTTILRAVTDTAVDCVNRAHQVWFIDPFELKYRPAQDQLVVSHAASGWRMVTRRICNGSTNGPIPVILGTGGADNLVGSEQAEIIDARGGADVIRGKGGDDIICAGPGDDTGNGGRGFDVVLGQAGRDGLAGAQGNDVLTGGTGRPGPAKEVLSGGVGHDNLYSALSGATRLEGNDGRDVLVGGTSGRIRFDGGTSFDVCALESSTLVVLERCERIWRY